MYRVLCVRARLALWYLLGRLKQGAIEVPQVMSKTPFTSEAETWSCCRVRRKDKAVEEWMEEMKKRPFE